MIKVLLFHLQEFNDNLCLHVSLLIFWEHIRFLDDGVSMMRCVSLSLSHTEQQSGCCFVLLHKHSHRRGAANRLPPFTHYPPTPLCALRGCIGAEKSSPPHFASSSPNFTQLRAHTHAHTHMHTHRDWNIGAHTNRTRPVNSCT